MWRTGDIVEFHVPMSVRTEPLPGNPDIVAILYGPIVLTGRLGRKGFAPQADIIVNERTYGDVLNDAVDVHEYEQEYWCHVIVPSKEMVQAIIINTHDLGWKLVCPTRRFRFNCFSAPFEGLDVRDILRDITR